jgi:type VI protein secretion system component Hcp
MQTVLFVKMQSQIRNTGCTSDHIQDMKMIDPLHQERQPLIQDKVKERNTQVNDGHNFLLYNTMKTMTNIMYTKKTDDLTPTLVIAIFSYLFSGKRYQNFIESYLE